jgi:hypothetical protein
VDVPNHLATLNAQTFSSVEVITWSDERWHADVAWICTAQNWAHLRVADQAEALEAARGGYLVGWDAYEASPDALSGLVDAADRAPKKRGALAANFDPLIMWRRDEFFRRTRRRGLAQSHVTAIGGYPAPRSIRCDTGLLPQCPRQNCRSASCRRRSGKEWRFVRRVVRTLRVLDRSPVRISRAPSTYGVRSRTDTSAVVAIGQARASIPRSTPSCTAWPTQ